MAYQRLQRIEYHGNADLSFDTVWFIILSSVLASVALLSNSVPVLIGAMILAPVFDPLVAIPFGIVSGNWMLSKRGAVTSAIIFAISLATCFATVSVLAFTNAIPETLRQVGPDMTTERLLLGWYSAITSFAAGAGGALAMASNRRQNLVGVVVALALVPSLAATAIGVLYEEPNGWNGLALFALNVGGIVLAGTAVLYLRLIAGKAEDAAGRFRGPDSQDD